MTLQSMEDATGLRRRAIDELRNKWFPEFSNHELETVLVACIKSDPSLIRHDVAIMNHDCIVGACFVGYIGWKCRGMNNLADIYEYFEEIWKKITNDESYFIWWYDADDYNTVISTLVYELNRELARRNNDPACTSFSCQSVAESCNLTV